MKIIKNAAVSCLVWVLFAGITYAETDVQKGTRLFRLFDQKPAFGRVKAFINLRIYDRNGNIRFQKRARMASYCENMGASNETEKFIAYFIEPADDIGNSILFYNYKDKPDEKFLYFKSLRKMKKLTGADRKLSFAGSDFSNADMSRPEFQDYAYRYLRDDKVTFKGKELECYVIQTQPVDSRVLREDGNGKVIVYLEKNTLIMLKVDYYNEQLEKYKEERLLTFITKNNARGKKVYYYTGLEMKNVKTGKKSVLVFTDYLFEEDSGISNYIFGVDYLTRKWW